MSISRVFVIIELVLCAVYKSAKTYGSIKYDLFYDVLFLFYSVRVVFSSVLESKMPAPMRNRLLRIYMAFKQNGHNRPFCLK